MIVAAEIEVDLARFAGKPMYRTTTGLALKKTAQELDKAVTEAKPYQPSGKPQAAAEGKKSRRAPSPPADRRLLYAADGSGRGPVHRALLSPSGSKRLK